MATTRHRRSGGQASRDRRRDLPAPQQWGFLAGVSVAFVLWSCLYCFVFGPGFTHVTAFWETPGDLGYTFLSAINLVHGRVSTVYGTVGLVSFPAILVLLLPFAALGNAETTTVVPISHNGQPVAHATGQAVQHFLFNPSLASGGGTTYVGQPQWLLDVFPFTLLISCLALFAFDALARQLGVGLVRRRLLVVAEAVLLWSPATVFGHPEDVLAVAVAAYALVCALQNRFAAAGWLFGLAVAFQPLVLLLAPVLLVMAGWPGAIAMAGRAVVPSVALLVVPLATGFSATVHTLLYQPNFPLIDQQTPWTALAPRISGHGRGLTVASGPGRLVAVALACGLGYRARRWRAQPDQLVWACAVALAVRCYTESVMNAYYTWPALAVAVLLTARRGPLRLASASLVAAATMFFSLVTPMAWLPWWLVTLGGLTVVLVLAAPGLGAPVVEEHATVRSSPAGRSAPPRRVGVPARSAPSAGKAATGRRPGPMTDARKGSAPPPRRKPPPPSPR